MVKFTTVDGKRKTFIISLTPPKQQFPHLNRKQRRSLVYGNVIGRLLDKIKELKKDMLDAGVETPKLPKNKNRKTLSGYYGVLMEMARKEIK